MSFGSVHQIWHGDSIELSKRFQPKRLVKCIMTDPPFGVDNQSNQAVTKSGKEYARKIANDESPEQAIAIFKAVMHELLQATTDDADCYVFTSYQVLSDWLTMTDDFMPKYGFVRKAILVWEKDGPGMGDLGCPWGMGSEFILFFRKGKRELGNFQRRNSVVRGPQIRPDKLIHPHEKPAWLLQMLMKASTSEGDFLVDPFGGSGSLVMAAREINRGAVAIELDQKNFELANGRLQSAPTDLFG